jgi:hypothetical protein
LILNFILQKIEIKNINFLNGISKTVSLIYFITNLHYNMGCDTTPLVFQKKNGKWIMLIASSVNNFEIDLWSVGEIYKNPMIMEFELQQRLELYPGFDTLKEFDFEEDAWNAAWDAYNDPERNFKHAPMRLCRVFLGINKMDKDIFFVPRLAKLPERLESGNGWIGYSPMPPPLHHCVNQHCDVCAQREFCSVCNSSLVYTTHSYSGFDDDARERLMDIMSELKV